MFEDEELGVTATADAPVTTEAPPQEQTPANPSDDLDARVNAILEQRLAEKLETEVKRGVQSEIQKRKNRADKQLAEDKRAIERMAQRGQLDEETKTRLLANAEQDAQQQRSVWLEDEEPAYQAPSYQVPPPQRQPEPVGQRGADLEAGFTKFVQDTYGFDLKESGLDYSKVLASNDPNSAEVRTFKQQAIAYAAEAQKRQSHADKVKTTKQNIGTIAGLPGGGTPPPNNPIEHITDRHELAALAADEEWSKLQR